ncbi:MAG: drug/metabolite transporter (DMT)-like permease [Alteromonadaceae bacterium]|jgi:drug/metabolite transporter (DMT)-like permease|tara:strand:- start:795 stop:1706 length:912 start_codon:yes stop_codon:yes gene_type:complete
MSVSVAYLAVVLIWSTTPLGIVWSSESVNPTLAVLARMVIAVVIGWLILRARNIRLPWHKAALRLYTFSALGIYGGMILSYLAAATVSSGMMSLIFGLAPLFSGLFSQKFLSEPRLSVMKKLSMTLSLFGLAIVCSDNLTLESSNQLGVLYIVMAVILFSLSGVLVKSVKININPVATTVGSLMTALPMFAITWLIFDGSLPFEQWQARSLWAILYLGVFGSLLGFIAYFYILQKLKASTVALITMVTPVLAMSLGVVLNDEVVSIPLIVGAVFVMSGLAIYNGGDKWIKQIQIRVNKKNLQV